MAELLENTETAYKAGAFGAPAFILKGTGKPQLFWGVDRMDFLARTIEDSRIMISHVLFSSVYLCGEKFRPVCGNLLQASGFFLPSVRGLTNN